jgi:uncharacterized protein
MPRTPTVILRRRFTHDWFPGRFRIILPVPNRPPEFPVPIPMHLRRIIISEVDDQQVIELQEIDGERSFPIVIGLFEATSIHRRVRGDTSPRPLTHDLIVSTVEALGGEIHDIIISDLEGGTYYAKLRVKQEGELHEIDCRPSDAIAVAVTAKVPIYVAEDVLGEATEDDDSNADDDDE